jgi:hypothetical protein
MCRFSGGDGDSLGRLRFRRCSVLLRFTRKFRPAKFNLNLLNINAEKRQNPLKDSRDTDQYHKEFKELRQPTIIGKLVYRPEADGADDNNNQNTNQS